MIKRIITVASLLIMLVATFSASGGDGVLPLRLDGHAEDLSRQIRSALEVNLAGQLKGLDLSALNAAPCEFLGRDALALSAADGVVSLGGETFSVLAVCERIARKEFEIFAARNDEFGLAKDAIRLVGQERRGTFSGDLIKINGRSSAMMRFELR